MIVSALLTSVGINIALCILFFTLYSVLRKQPGNFAIYAPRALAEGKFRRSNHFDLGRLLPTLGWIKSAWQPSEEELLSSSGLDAVVLLRIIIFSMKVFVVAGIIGIFILLPVNCSGDQLVDVDIANITNNSLDVFSISNVNNGSKWLWIHFSAVYIFTIIVCFLLYYEFKYVSSKRIDYFHASIPRPHQFTVLVRNIPVSAGTSVSNSVESFFTENYPATYLSHVVVRRTIKIQVLINNTKNLYQRLISLKKEPTRSKFKRSGFLGLFGHKVNLVDHYEKKLEDLEENVRLELSDVSSAEREVRAAFVSFKSRYGAATALHMQQSNNPTQWLTENAPEPQDVYWPFFSSTFISRWISKLAVIVACGLLTVLFLLPVLVVQGLTNLAQLEVYFPFLKGILTTTIVRQVVIGYLPNLILLMFLKMIPPIMKFLSSLQGYIATSEIEISACNKVLLFTIWNIFLANVLSGSVINQIFILLEPKNIPTKLAVAVPAQASFFIAYVVTSGWTSTASELFLVVPLIFSLICKLFVRSSEVEPRSFPYHKDVPKILFFCLIGITYFFLFPLILPFLLVYFVLAYIIYRNQGRRFMSQNQNPSVWDLFDIRKTLFCTVAVVLMNVYSRKYETGGRFWPIAHNSVIFSLVLMHAIAVGIFTLKKLPVASTLIIPLPIFTLLFNEYCRKRFLPIFMSFSTETLRKKDREDQNDASMAQFLENLASAYQDPELMPIKYTTNSNSRSTPLLSSTDV